MELLLKQLQKPFGPLGTPLGLNTSCSLTCATEFMVLWCLVCGANGAICSLNFGQFSRNLTKFELYMASFRTTNPPFLGTFTDQVVGWVCFQQCLYQINACISALLPDSLAHSWADIDASKKWRIKMALGNMQRQMYKHFKGFMSMKKRVPKHIQHLHINRKNINNQLKRFNMVDCYYTYGLKADCWHWPDEFITNWNYPMTISCLGEQINQGTPPSGA